MQRFTSRTSQSTSLERQGKAMESLRHKETMSFGQFMGTLRSIHSNYGGEDVASDR